MNDGSRGGHGSRIRLWIRRCRLASAGCATSTTRLGVGWLWRGMTSRSLGDLVSTSSALLTTIRQMQVATRRRALLEMAGLLMVAVGTVLSSLPVDRG